MPRGIQQNRRGYKKFGLRECRICKRLLKLDNNSFYNKYTGVGHGGFCWECKDCHRERNRKYNKGTTLKLRFDIFAKFNFTCQYCGQKAPDVILHVDHIFPKSKGGTDDPSNLTVACSDCNIGKGATTL